MRATEIEEGLLSASLNVKERLRLFLIIRSNQPSFSVCVAKHHVLEALPVRIWHIQHAVDGRCDFPRLQPYPIDVGIADLVVDRLPFDLGIK